MRRARCLPATAPQYKGGGGGGGGRMGMAQGGVMVRQAELRVKHKKVRPHARMCVCMYYLSLLYVIPPPECEYVDPNAGMTEIYLRCATPIAILVPRSRYVEDGVCVCAQGRAASQLQLVTLYPHALMFFERAVGWRPGPVLPTSCL
jgi:hypothetical protein